MYACAVPLKALKHRSHFRQNDLYRFIRNKLIIGVTFTITSTAKQNLNAKPE